MAKLWVHDVSIPMIPSCCKGEMERVDFFGAKIGSATSTLGFAEASQPVRIQYVVWSVDPREKNIPRHTTHR